MNSRCIFLWRNNLGIYTGSVMSLMQKKASKSHTILSKHSSYYLVIFLEFLQWDNEIFFREINFTKKFREKDLTENCVLDFFASDSYGQPSNPLDAPASS